MLTPFGVSVLTLEKLDKVTQGVSEVGHAADCNHIDPGALSHCSPCIVLFSDNPLLYRAESIDKVGDELSVLFVDYRNVRCEGNSP